jgi:glutathione S-transferase
MFTLVHYPLCPFSRSIRLALAECELDVRFEEQKPWDWSESFLQINPAGTLPVLRDRSETICGAYAISEYLADCGADESGDPRAFAFFPGEEGERAETRRLVDWFHGKFDDEVSSYLLGEKLHRRFDPAKGGGAPDMELVRAGQANLRYHLSYIGHLTASRNWLAGEHLSFADLTAAAHLSCVDYLGDVPWAEAEAAKEWYARIKSRRSFRTLLTDRIPALKPPDYYADPDF